MKEIKEVKVPLDIKKAIEENKKAKETWQGTTAVARRDWIAWAISGKKAETRQLRIGKLISMLEGGKMRVCCFPGIKWLLRDKAISEDVKEQLRKML
ncbi:MAG TPA: YdeI/OmpD-associated family protein [Candidatus Nanoarchaeia archaeon]|nr:YdeI/OmpD-associated family protein [Candidatus Nanoarchaeia archaeon]